MKYKIILQTLLFQLTFIVGLIAQNPFPENGKAFQDNIVPRILIKFPADSLATMLNRENWLSDHHYQAQFIFDNGTKRDTIENIGFRLRGNTSRGAAKKSFKISFNTFKKGREWKGLEKMNLNGEHNDPSVSRSKLGWDLLREFGVPAPRCNQVELYINASYYGLYANVEQIDEEFVQSRFGNKDGNLFKCLYPADLAFHGMDPTGYKKESNGRRVYDLKTNKEADNYSDLINFLNVLNNTPNETLPCELEKIFNVDDYLKVIAFDIISANWDGPIFNKNNFYLYHNTATDKFEYIPFDIDNTFGIDWFSIDWATRDIYNWAAEGQTRPIYNRIMGIPEYRNRFSYYYNQFLRKHLQEEVITEYLYNRKNLLLPSIQKDPYYPLDYGFRANDFLTSFDNKLEVFHVPTGIIEYLNRRRNSGLQQVQLMDISPIVHAEVDLSNSENRILVNLSAIDDQMIIEIEECIINKSGNLSCITLESPSAASIHNISTFTNTETIVGIYYNVYDDQNNITRFPNCGLIQLPKTKIVSTTLFLNEVVASNETTIADEAGEFEDWIEIYNPNDESVNLNGLHLSDNPTIPNKWSFPDLTIPAKAFLLIWADDDTGQGVLHTNFKLSKGGEFIGIFDTEANDYALIDGFEFDDQETDIAFGRFPDGAPNLEVLIPTPASTNGKLTAIETVSINTINVFPNPTTQSFQLDLSGVNLPIQKIRINDITGKTVQVIDSIFSNKIDVTLPTLPKGMYLIIIELENQKQILKKVLID